MTEEEKKAVEAKEAADAAAAAAKANEPSELEKQLAEADATIAQLTVEKNNYKKGMLKAKGKLPDEEEEDIDEKINRMVSEKLLDTQLSIAEKKKEELLKSSIARIKELETTIKNRSQISGADAGAGNEAKFTPKDNVLSDDKLKQLKAMGWDDEKIARYKSNLMKMR